MTSLTWDMLRANRGRYVPCAAAIAVAVAFVALILSAAPTVTAGMSRAVAAPFGGTDVVVTAPNEQTARAVAERAGRELGASAAVDALAPVSVRREDGTGPSRVVMLTELAGQDGLRWQNVADGRLPITDGELLVPDANPLDVGDRLRLSTFDGRVVSAVVVGKMAAEQLVSGQEPPPVYAPAATVAAMRSAEAVETTVRLAVDGDAATAAQAVRRIAPAGTTVTTGDERVRAEVGRFTGGAGALSIALSCFAAVTVFVAVLVVGNTFAVVLASRGRELGMLRLVGATPRQVRRAVRLEALVLGVLASAVGLLVAAVLGFGASAVVRNVAPALPFGYLAVPWWAPVAAFIVGIAASVLGTWRAAARAAAGDPLGAVASSASDDESPAGSWLRTAAGGAAAVGGGALLAFGALAVSIPAATLGCIVMFSGLLLVFARLLPALFRGLAGAGAAVARRLSGRRAGAAGIADVVVGNLRRHPRRAAATATAVVVGVTLVTTMLVGAAVLRDAGAEKVDRETAVDVIVGGRIPGGVPGTVAAEPGVVGAVVAGPLPQVVVAGQPVDVRSLDTAALARTVRSGIRLPGRGEIGLPQDVRERLDVSVGEVVDVESATGHRRLRVVESVLLGPVVDAADLGPARSVDMLYVRIAEDVDRQAVADRVLEIAQLAGPGVTATSLVDLRAEFENTLDVLLAIVLGLGAVAVLVGVIGLVNTTRLAVIDRRRETATLRLVGAAGRDVVRMFALESAVIASVAAAVGVGLGLLYGVLGARSVVGAVSLGAVPWVSAGLLVVAGTVVGVAAAVLPARAALRDDPMAALAR